MKTQIKSRYNPWKLLLVVLMLLPSMLEAQYIYNMNPDSVFHDGEDYRWFPNETVMYGFQGTIFVFTCEYIEDGVTVTVYTIDHNGKLSAYKMLPGNVNYFTYGFPDELEWYQGMQGNAIAFEYNGEMWHYYNQKAKSTLTHSTDDSYDCFAHMPANSTAQAHGYYDLVSGKIKIIKKTAFQHDSCLYFLGVYAQSDDPNYGKWCVQKYAYDKPNDKFIWKWNHLIADIPGNMAGGIVPHVDTSGQVRLVLNTYDTKNTQSYLGWLLASTPPGGETDFSYEIPFGPYTIMNGCKASVLLGGTAKGGRTIENMDILYSSERMVLFGYANNGVSDINYVELNFGTDIFAQVNMGSIVIPSSMKPDDRNGAINMAGAIELVPKKLTNMVGDQADGFQQQNWIYYPDKYGQICGLRFTSDTWRPVPELNIISDDLANDAPTDSTYGPGIRSLWSLVGLLDNAPPCSINWEEWDSHYFPDYRPTETSLSVGTEYTTKVTTTTEDQYSVGGEVNTGNKHASFNIGLHCAAAFKTKVSSTKTWMNKLTLPFELNEASQELGVYVYSVPIITRYTYYRFPWWSTDSRYPVRSSEEYRFVTATTAIIYKYPDISSFPFLINEPNGMTLQDWTMDQRTLMKRDLHSSSMGAVCAATWKSPGKGQTGNFEVLKDTTSEYATQTKYQADATTTFAIPEVFKARISGGHEINYETSTENESSVTKKAEVSLGNLTEATLGPQITSYIVSTYWFRSEDYDWWFYDSLGTDRPWYLAYVVNSVNQLLSLTSPLPGENLKSSGALFNWEPVGFEPVGCTFILSTTAHITPPRIVYKADCGTMTSHYLASLPFCKEGEQYYWAVRAEDQEGNFIWSESRPLMVHGDGTKATDQQLSVVPYPNPGCGNHLHLLVDTRETGTLDIRISSLSGLTVYHNTVGINQPNQQTVDLPGVSLEPGVYLIETSIAGNKAIRKLVVQR